MSQEFFWGCELSKDQPEVEWHPEAEIEDNSTDNDSKLMHTLFLTHAHIGTEEAEMDGEANVIELETMGYCNKPIKQPIIRLQCGIMEECKLEVLIPKLATFRLINGEGPVFLHGQHLIEWDDDDDYEDDLPVTEASQEVAKCRDSMSDVSGRKKDGSCIVVGKKEEGKDDDECCGKTRKCFKIKSKSKLIG